MNKKIEIIEMKLPISYLPRIFIYLLTLTSFNCPTSQNVLSFLAEIILPFGLKLARVIWCQITHQTSVSQLRFRGTLGFRGHPSRVPQPSSMAPHCSKIWIFKFVFKLWAFLIGKIIMKLVKYLWTIQYVYWKAVCLEFKATF